MCICKFCSKFTANVYRFIFFDEQVYRLIHPDIDAEIKALGCSYATYQSLSHYITRGYSVGGRTIYYFKIENILEKDFAWLREEDFAWLFGCQNAHAQLRKALRKMRSYGKDRSQIIGQRRQENHTTLRESHITSKSLFIIGKTKKL